jgi:hypothetical protein
MRAKRIASCTTITCVLAFLALLSAPLARAQDGADNALATEPAGTVSCFDYYKFGSVQAKLTAPVAGTVSGANITFSGTLENANPYPVVDGALYVKVFKSRGDANDGNGPDVVDQFFVRDNIAIPANSSVPVSFQWRVPSYAQSGDYRLATFFTTAHKFNLLGLSFTDDVVGNAVPFKVLGEQEVGVAFDKPSVTVNDETYYFAAFPPRFDAAEPVVLTANVENTGIASERATISWKMYQWDAQQDGNLVQQSSSGVTVPAGGSAPVSITITDAKYPVYLVVGELLWRDTKSIIGVRFVREGVDRTRINFPSIISFPLKAGEENTLFSCLHNAAETDAPDGRLELTLYDRNGRTITEYVYDGTVTSAMMGVASMFTPRRGYDYAVLDARLYAGDTLVDEAHVVYDCAQIDPAQCAPENHMWLYYVFGGVVVLLAGFWFLRMRRPVGAPPPPSVS